MAQRILIVEDDADFQLMLQLGLEQAGYLVQPAHSGQSALRWLRDPQSKPDLVILDIGLPDKDMDGLTLCRALKKDALTAKIPVVILSGQASNEKRLEAQLAKADLVLHKPIALATLLEAAAKLLAAPPESRRGVLRRGALEVDPEARSVFFAGQPLTDLGARLFDAFYVIVERAPQAVSPRALLGALRLKVRDDQAAVIVSRLRKKLRDAFGHDLVATVPNQGYRLDLPASRPIRLPG
jgi:DNA-binding response OmpR family regulator